MGFNSGFKGLITYVVRPEKMLMSGQWPSSVQRPWTP